MNRHKMARHSTSVSLNKVRDSLMPMVRLKYYLRPTPALTEFHFLALAIT